MIKVASQVLNIFCIKIIWNSWLHLRWVTSNNGPERFTMCFIIFWVMNLSFSFTLITSNPSCHFETLSLLYQIAFITSPEVNGIILISFCWTEKNEDIPVIHAIDAGFNCVHTWVSVTFDLVHYWRIVLWLWFVFIES